MFYKDKKVLVTGGTGFVGTNIVAALLKQGARVRVPLHQRPLPVPDEQLEIVPADLTRQEDCLAIVKGVDCVFHAAGAVGAAPTLPGDQMAGITVNLILTTQILQAAWSAGVDRFLLFGSSTGYPAVDYPVKETDMWHGPPHPSYFGYGWMRRYLEKLGEYVAVNSGMKLTIVRPGAVYGRWDNFNPATSHVIPALISRAVAKEDPFEVWGTGDEVRDFLHISDFARGCLDALADYAVGEPVNIACGEGVTIKETVRLILKAAGHEQAEVVFNDSKPTAIPLRMIDISLAREVLGFKPEVSLEDGLNDTVRFYRELYNK